MLATVAWKFLKISKNLDKVRNAIYFVSISNFQVAHTNLQFMDLRAKVHAGKSHGDAWNTKQSFFEIFFEHPL